MGKILINVYSVEGKRVGEKELPEGVFGIKPNDIVIYEAIKMYQANQRQGSASTKTRGEVRGGGRKPWRQKGTGRARAGSRRSPIWRGGGIIFGPKPRNYHYRINKKKLKLALLSTISYKQKEGRILLVDKFQFPEIKTKMFSHMMKNLGLTERKVLFIPQKVERTFLLSGRNIPGVVIKRAMEINALDVAGVHTLVFSLDGVEEFIKRMSS
jgi:large subunit ribosomal protein L4